MLFRVKIFVKYLILKQLSKVNGDLIIYHFLSFIKKLLKKNLTKKKKERKGLIFQKHQIINNSEECFLSQPQILGLLGRNVLVFHKGEKKIPWS